MSKRVFISYLVLITCFISFRLFPQKQVDTLAIKKLLHRAHALEAKDLDSAFKITQKAYLLSQNAGYNWGLGESLHRFGTILSQKGDHDTAIKYLRLALGIRRGMKDRKLEAYTATNLGIAFQQKGDKDSSLHYIYSALNLYKKLNDSSGMADTYNDLGNFYFEYGDSRSALDLLSLSAPIFEKLKDTLHLSETYKLNGIIYYYSLDPGKALGYFLKAKALDEKLNKELLLARDWNYLGLCYEALNKDLLARSSFRKALAFFIRYGETQSVAEVYYNTGVFFNKRSQPDSALFYLEKSNGVLKNTQEEEMKISVYSALAETYALKGNYLKAYDYHVQYADLSDSLLNKEKVKQIAEMQTRYDTEKKSQEIILLGEQNKTKHAQRNFFIAGSGVLLLGLFVLGFYYWQRSRLARKNEQIAREQITGLLKEQEIKSYNAMIEGQEEERKRIATDLHDRLGSMLSTVKLLFGSLNEKIDKNQDEGQKQYSKATSLLDEAVLEVRRISHNLSTGMVNTFGLIPALEELCESIEKSRIIKCRLLYYGMDERLDQQTEIGIFRILQELVNNTLKHAKARQLTIQLNRTGESVNVTMEDDGVGFDVEEKKKSGGMGLKNLGARAAKLNGVYHVDSMPGRGTISIIEIPLVNNENTTAHSG